MHDPHLRLTMHFYFQPLQLTLQKCISHADSVYSAMTSTTSIPCILFFLCKKQNIHLVLTRSVWSFTESSGVCAPMIQMLRIGLICCSVYVKKIWKLRLLLIQNWFNAFAYKSSAESISISQEMTDITPLSLSASLSYPLFLLMLFRLWAHQEAPQSGVKLAPGKGQCTAFRPLSTNRLSVCISPTLPLPHHGFGALSLRSIHPSLPPSLCQYHLALSTRHI